MYYAMRASAPSLHRESTDSLICVITIIVYHIIDLPLLPLGVVGGVF